MADVPVPPFLRESLYGAFASIAGIDLAEAGNPLREYRTFDEFFIRRLRPGLREWPADDAALGSPVDGTIGETGTIRDGVLLQAKGQPYSAAALLDDEAEAGRYDGGGFLTLYLSPRDYHRIHAPASGRVSKARHIPGRLLPVNEPAIHHVASLFPRNERVVCYIDGEAGRTAVVAVGAFNVGRIEVVFDSRWRSNRRGAASRDVLYDPPHGIDRGDELMIFHLGSTVVLLLEPERARFAEGLRTGAHIRLGQAIGSRTG
jgi:phosphatidylserine decarboxylase